MLGVIKRPHTLFFIKKPNLRGQGGMEEIL